MALKSSHPDAELGKKTKFENKKYVTLTYSARSSPHSYNTFSDADMGSQKYWASCMEGLKVCNRKSCKPSPRTISDAILGLSDGLTVPFALTAGLSALGDTRVVVLGGLAELIAGAISMGLGGFVGAKSEVSVFQTSPNINC